MYNLTLNDDYLFLHPYQFFILTIDLVSLNDVFMTSALDVLN